MKKILLLIVVGIFLVSSVSAQESPISIFKEGKMVDLIFICTNNNSLCSSTASCNVSINYQNRTLLINNQIATNQNTHFNYTLNSTQTTPSGDYLFTSFCIDGDYKGHDTFPYKITPSGREAPSIGESITYIATIVVMLLFAVIFFAISFIFKKDDRGDYPSHGAGLKFGFIAISLVIALITLLYVSVTIQEILWGFDKITSGFTTFHYIILFLFLLMFIFVMLVIIFEIMEKMQLKRGLKIENPVNPNKPYP